MTKIPSYRLHKASGQGTTKLQGKCYYFGSFGDPESKRRLNELMSQYVLSDNATNFGKALDLSPQTNRRRATLRSCDLHRNIPTVVRSGKDCNRAIQYIRYASLALLCN